MKMSQSEFDEELYLEATNPDFKWHGYMCTLKLEDGVITVKNGNEDLNSTQYVQFNHGYLIGAYLWHDGWLRWFSHASSHYPEGQEPIIRLLSKENCRYIIKEDNDNAIIVSVLPTIGVGDDYITDGETIIYDFDVNWDKNDEEDGYELALTEIARFAGETRAYFKDGNDFYFVTDQSITKMTRDGKTEVLVRSHIFYQIGVDSIVLFEDATDIIGLKQNPTNGRRFSPIFSFIGRFSIQFDKMLLLKQRRKTEYGKDKAFVDLSKSMNAFRHFREQEALWQTQLKRYRWRNYILFRITHSA